MKTFSGAMVCVPTLCKWVVFELNHSVGGNWALKEPIWHCERFDRLNSLVSNDSFSENKMIQ